MLSRTMIWRKERSNWSRPRRRWWWRTATWRQRIEPDNETHRAPAAPGSTLRWYWTRRCLSVTVHIGPFVASVSEDWLGVPWSAPKDSCKFVCVDLVSAARLRNPGKEKMKPCLFWEKLWSGWGFASYNPINPIMISSFCPPDQTSRLCVSLRTRRNLSLWIPGGVC
jgi:hypothetical protein